MKYVLDASVAVAAVRAGEPSHAASRARLATLLTGQDDIVVPAIFDVEVTSALVRAGVAPSLAATFLERDLGARHLVTIGPRAAHGIVAVVNATRLRAADAAYVWTAASRGLVLVSQDDEIVRRAGGLCRVERPWAADRQTLV